MSGNGAWTGMTLTTIPMVLPRTRRDRFRAYTAYYVAVRGMKCRSHAVSLTGVTVCPMNVASIAAFAPSAFRLPLMTGGYHAPEKLLECVKFLSVDQSKCTDVIFIDGERKKVTAV